jgi:hypothetical protein
MPINPSHAHGQVLLNQLCAGNCIDAAGRIRAWSAKFGQFRWSILKRSTLTTRTISSEVCASATTTRPLLDIGDAANSASASSR